MSRKAIDTPWLQNATGWWCATVGGKRVYLAKDNRLACRKLKVLLTRRRQEGNFNQDWLAARFCELADEFLANVEGSVKPGTYTAYRYDLLRALRVLGKALRVGDIRKFHLAKIQQALKKQGRSPTTIRSTITTVQGVLNWAVRCEIFDSNWLAGFKKPRPRRRHRVVTPREFRALMRHTDRNFKCFLIALRLTGCRPAEVANLVWECVNLATGMWILPDHKTVTQQEEPSPRLIPLPRLLLRLCRWLARQPHGSGDHVFLNKHGSPYSKDCWVHKMARLRSRAGIGVIAGENLVLYGNRHWYITERVGRVSDIELAELTGHTEVRMLRRYRHVSPEHLVDIERRASKRR